jgi:hypothetical protein
MDNGACIIEHAYDIIVAEKEKYPNRILNDHGKRVQIRFSCHNEARHLKAGTYTMTSYSYQQRICSLRTVIVKCINPQISYIQMQR